MKKDLLLPALLGALAVAFGAFGAHALEHRLTERALEVWDTANRYHILHSLAVLIIQISALKGLKKTKATLSLWIAGIVIFSGGLYFYALTGVKIGAILAPIGGLAFIGGWLSLVRCEFDDA